MASESDNKLSVISKLNDAPLFKTISNINGVLVLLNRVTDAAETAASAVASVFDAAAVVDSTLNDNLVYMQSSLSDVAAAIYEKFQEPMYDAVNEVTRYADRLAESITNGALSENFDKIAAGMADLASGAIQLVAEDVLPAVINAMAWVIDNGQILSTVLEGAAAAFITYKTAAAGIEIANKIGDILNSLNSTALIISAAAAGGMAIKALIDSASEGFEMYGLDNTTRALYDQVEAYDRSVRYAEKNIEKVNENANAAKHYLEIIEELVDENGHAKVFIDENGNATDSANKLQVAVEKLNEAAGTNIEVIDGQIQGYKDLANAIGNNIELSRIAAQKSYLWDSYGEAMLNYDDTKARKDAAKKEREDAYRAYRKELGRLEMAENAKNNSTFGLSKDDIDTIKENVEATKEAFEAASLEYDAISQLYTSYEDVINKYEGLSEEEKNINLSVEVNVDDNIDDDLENAVTEVEEIVADALDTYANNPDTQHSLDNIFSYNTLAAEDTVDDVKDTMRDMWDTISKQEKLGLISSEEAYKQQLALIEKYCPEYADEWYSYYQEILEYQRDALREQVQGVRDSISDIVSEYQTEFSKIEDSINSYKNRLLAVESVFTVKTETDDQGNESKTYTVENMTKQMEKMQKYHNLVKNLKDRGVSSEVLSELTTFDFDDGMVFAENLAMSSDEELEKITALYAERDKLAEDLANELYAPEMDKLNEELLVDITAQFGTLPEEIRAIGGQSLAAFAEGLLENKENLTEAAQEFISSFFEACDEGISSGSVGMANVGENIAAMLAEQDTYSIGYESGSSFAKGLSDALNNVNDAFSKIMSGHADVSASLITSGQTDTVNYGAASWSGSSGGSKSERIILENKEEVTVKIDREVLGKTVMEWTKEYQRRTGT